MIQEVSAYRVGVQVFPTIQEAQKQELKALVKGPEADNFAQWAIAHADEIIAILTCQPKSKKPRSDKGKSHRKPAVSNPETRCAHSDLAANAKP